MSKLIDLTGQKFGRLTVLYKLHNYHKKRVHWLCLCDCGNLVEVRGDSLRRGLSKSCKCYMKDIVTKHGKSSTHLHKVWAMMKDRCYNEHNNRYKNYGDRGIVVCSEWKDNFEAFYNWAIDNGYQEGLTIDRIDVNGNYDPSNCRWATVKQQSRNTSRNRYITYNGETRCLAEWCEIFNLNSSTVRSRIKYGWPIEKVFTKPLK